MFNDPLELGMHTTSSAASSGDSAGHRISLGSARGRRGPKQGPGWKCHLCDRRFKKNEHLNRHIVSHTKEKPFQCESCHRSYSRYDSLLRHARVHTGQEPRSSHSSHALSPSFSAGQRDAQHGGHTQQDSNAEQLPSIAPNPGSMGNASSTVNEFLDEPTSNMTAPNPIGMGPPTSSIGEALPIAQDIEFYGVDPIDAGPASRFNGTGNFSSMIERVLDTDLWNNASDYADPQWLLGSNFDINAFNESIAATLSTPNPLNIAGLTGGRNSPAAAGEDSSTNILPPPPRMQDIWPTRLAPSPKSHQDAESQPDKDQVDDDYRVNLSHRLRPQLRDGMLPSSHFLNLSIKLFFTKFNPIFPLIHAASFRPSSENALLVLSICSIGALFVGTANAAAQGREIFLRLNKAILASWETYLYGQEHERLTVAQAAILGQTFGMLSGNSTDLLLTHSFHGTVLAWAQHGGMFKTKAVLPPVQDLDAAETEMAWKRWAETEEIMRLVLGLFIHDSEFATLFHTDPYLRHNEEGLPQCSSDELFAAQTAARWAAIVRRDIDQQQQQQEQRLGTRSENRRHSNCQPSSSSQLWTYAVLSGLVASICESQGRLNHNERIPEFSEELQRWWHVRPEKTHDLKDGPSQLKVLWHGAYILLYANIDLLERLIGREGSCQSSDLDAAYAWASSSEARRSVLHAGLALKSAESGSYRTEPAIHVPKVLFHAGIVIYSYVKFHREGDEDAQHSQHAHFPPGEFQCLAGLATPRACLNLLQIIGLDTLSSVVDLLSRIGHWDLSRRFRVILETLLNDLT